MNTARMIGEVLRRHKKGNDAPKVGLGLASGETVVGYIDTLNVPDGYVEILLDHNGRITAHRLVSLEAIQYVDLLQWRPQL